MSFFKTGLKNSLNILSKNNSHKIRICCLIFIIYSGQVKELSDHIRQHNINMAYLCLENALEPYTMTHIVHHNQQCSNYQVISIMPAWIRSGMNKLAETLFEKGKQTRLLRLKTLSRYSILLLLWLVAADSTLFAQDNDFVLDSLRRKYEKAGNDSTRIYILVEISRFYSTSDLKQSIRHAEKAMEIATKSESNKLISYALFNAGNAYFMQGMYETATGYFYRYLDIQKQLNHQPGIAFALANIGAIRIKMQDYKTAKYNLLKGLEILRGNITEQEQSEYKDHITNILNNLGIVYQTLHNNDSALWYYREGIRLSDYLQDPGYFQASLYNNIGGLFLENQQPDSAYLPLQKAMNLRISRKDLAGQSASHIRFGEYYLLTGNRREALLHFYEGMHVAKKIGSIDLQSKATEKLYNYFKQSGNADSALKYFELYNAFVQTLNNEETVKELTRLELLSDFRENQRLTRLEQDRLNTIYLFTVVLLLLLLTMFVLLYIIKNNRVNRLNLEKNNLRLAGLNAVLEKENFEKELEIRNKELSTHVMGMIRKNETIGQIIEVLSSRITGENEGFFNQIIRELSALQDKKAWDEFEVRYQQVHNEFYQKLQKVSPHLTTNERRLCAFLRLNMTTKDISSITGQSIRSIEVARTRLRRKLEISNSDISLVEFLNSL